MKANLPKYLLLAADLAAILIAFRVAYFLRYESAIVPLYNLPVFPFWAYGYAILLALGTWIFIFLVYGVDNFPGAAESPLAASKLITASFFLTASLLAGMYLAKAYYSRLLFLFLAVLVVIFLVFTRLLYQAALSLMRRHGLGLRRVVIVGHSELAAEIAERLGRRLDLHYEIVGFLAPAVARSQAGGDSNPVEHEAIMTGSEAMARELAAKNVHELLFAIPIRRDTETLEFIAHCQQQGITIKSVPEYYDLHTSHIERLSIDGIPILEMKQTSLHSSHELLKRITDVGLVVLTAPVTVPALVLISAALRVTRRRGIRGETRIGLGGRPFKLYRFDVHPAEAPDPRTDEPRQRGFAGFLLRYSFSELPQIWNVLKGDMSVVGPQPESPERARHYSAWHRRRLQLKPGITGLAQVQGLRDLDSSDLKTKYDLEYAANYTPLVDLALVVSTVSTLLSRRNAFSGGPRPRSAGFPGAPVPSDPLNISES
ncbi:MAG: sugar transferase [Terriglobia bacterium]